MGLASRSFSAAQIFMFRSPLLLWLVRVGLDCEALFIYNPKALAMQHWWQRSTSRRTIVCVATASTKNNKRSLYSTETALSAMKFTETADTGDFWSLDSLRKRFQDHVQNSRVPLDRRDRAGLCVAIAGGGSSFLSALAATPGASTILMDGTLLYGRESHRDYLKVPPTDERIESLVSSQSAEQLADAACRRALALITTHDSRDKDLRHYRSARGLSCTSMLQSTSSKLKSEAYLACHGSLSDDPFVSIHVKLNAERDRLEEDVFVGHCMLSTLQIFEASMSMEDVAGVLPTELKVLQSDEKTIEAATTHGDSLHIEIHHDALKTTTERVEKAAERVLTGSAKAVMIRPNDDNSGFEVLRDACITKDALVFPGSFNPPHHGHAALARASVDAMDQCDIIFFELSITNPDKPSIPATEVAKRVQKFLDLAKEEFDGIEKWGVLLTDAPLFTQKASILAPSHGRLTFAIGSDTLVRIIDPKYYNNSRTEMLSVLTQMNCNFVVGGRLEQKLSSGEFVSGSEHLEEMPDKLASRFTLIPDFRVDISSTEIRRQQEQKQH